MLFLIMLLHHVIPPLVCFTGLLFVMSFLPDENAEYCKGYENGYLRVFGSVGKAIPPCPETDVTELNVLPYKAGVEQGIQDANALLAFNKK